MAQGSLVEVRAHPSQEAEAEAGKPYAVAAMHLVGVEVVEQILAQSPEVGALR